MAKRITGIDRIRLGPKHSRVKVGYRSFIFLILTALLIGAYAIAVNIDLQDRLNAHNASLQEEP